MTREEALLTFYKLTMDAVDNGEAFDGYRHLFYTDDGDLRVEFTVDVGHAILDRFSVHGWLPAQSDDRILNVLTDCIIDYYSA